jgi:hypothetical protein
MRSCIIRYVGVEADIVLAGRHQGRMADLAEAIAEVAGREHRVAAVGRQVVGEQFGHAGCTRCGAARGA